MKINSPSSSKKLRVIVAIAIIALIIGAVSYALLKNKQPSVANDRDESGISYAEPSKDELDAGQKAKQDTIEASKNNGQTGSDPAPTPTKQTDGSKSIVGVNISAAYKSGDNYRIQTLIQTVTSSGTCTLTMTNITGQQYTETVGVQALPSSSTCKGFTIPMAKLSTGSWSITIKFENDTLQGIATKEVQVS